MEKERERDHFRRMAASTHICIYAWIMQGFDLLLWFYPCFKERFGSTDFSWIASVLIRCSPQLDVSFFFVLSFSGCLPTTSNTSLHHHKYFNTCYVRMTGTFIYLIKKTHRFLSAFINCNCHLSSNQVNSLKGLWFHTWISKLQFNKVIRTGQR